MKSALAPIGIVSALAVGLGVAPLLIASPYPGAGHPTGTARAQSPFELPGRPEEFRRLDLRSASQRASAIYWIGGDYIPEILADFGQFLSDTAGADILVSPLLLDMLAAVQRLVGAFEITIERIAAPTVPGGPVTLALSMEGHEPEEICRAFAWMERQEPESFCTPDAGSPANPVTFGTAPYHYAVTWQDGLQPPSPELLALLERPLPATDGGMALQFLRHDTPSATNPPQDHQHAAPACTHRLTGRIRTGDGARLAAALTEMAQARSRARERGQDVGRIVLCLDSPGGALLDGLQLAEAILEAGLPTRVEADARCESACFWAFMAGNQRASDGTRLPGRVLAPGGRLGFHAPALDIDLADPTTAEIGAAMQLGIDAAAQIAAPFAQAGAFGDGQPILKPSLLTEMLGTAPDRMRRIDTVDDAGRWDIQLSLRPPGPHHLTDFVRACQSRIAWRRDQTHAMMRSALSANTDAGAVAVHRAGSDTVLCRFPAQGMVFEEGRLRQAVPMGEPAMLFFDPRTAIASFADE